MELILKLLWVMCTGITNHNSNPSRVTEVSYFDHELIIPVRINVGLLKMNKYM